ncbi:hypothetical protein C6989_00420 [Nitrosopumilus sp. b2]|nr:hypothetical protein C6989_00420 [Nitrosopumilus sp. b2]
MAPRCKGYCIDFKTKRFEGGLKYQNGLKWCSICSRFIHTELIRCSCCNTRLRNRAKNRIYQKRTKLI